jgi:hypothetical protein
MILGLQMDFVDLLFAIIYGITCGVIGFVWCIVLTDKGMIFNRLNRYLHNTLNTQKQILEAEYSWMYKILIGCERCFSGQFALWTYIALSIYGSIDYSLLTHIICTSYSICTAAIITKTYNK